ncbi:MAG: flavin reductase family protein [Parvibaculum sp.]|nr:flavin reductase family protein [Parvibaculum sp.]
MTDDVKRKFRNALGHFATGVAVITTCGQGKSPIGITVNSFSSVSLDPPLILWSLDKKSDTFALFNSVDHFTVNILREDHREISNQLAKQGDHSLEGLAIRKGSNGCPALEQALAHFECDVYARHEAGDHIIMLGRVTHFEYSEDGRPLLYHRGGYQGLAVGNL